MSEWKEKTLNEVCQKITDGSHYSPIDVNSGYPMLSVKDMREYEFDFSSCKHISFEDFCMMRQNDCIPQVGDVLVAKDGSYLKEIFCCKEYRDIAILSSIAIFRPNQSIILPSFLCYLLKTSFIFNYISKNCVSGSALPRIVLKSFKDVRIPVPDLFTQSKIAGILLSLDAKIETNNKLNEKLEEMAQAIFKSWFVDFEPFKNQPFHETELGMIPEGWEVTTIGENLKTALGGTPSRNRDDYWNGEIAWINSGEINKFRIIQASEYITENGLKSSATKLLPAKTTVLAITGATLGQVSLLEIDTCANQSVIGVLESDAIKHQFIYPLIKSQIKYLILHQTGGAQQHINKQNVDSIQFVLPPKDILDEYQIITKKIFDQISTLCFENQRLASLRDTLLPRLMSGEIKI